MKDAVLDEREARDRIASQLLALGLRQGGVALVHSSLSSLGEVPGGAETVVQGLLGALGPEGTLMFPALTYESVHAGQTRFDVRQTPSCVGAIPEHFRLRQGSRRSIHPTHSVCAVGPMTEELLGEHHLGNTPCGPLSPFRKLSDVRGQIVFLGCGLRPNTSMHGVEELVEPPYLFGPRLEYVEYQVTLPDGQEIALRCRHHNFGRYRQRYERIADLLERGSELREGSVLKAHVHILDAEAVWREGEAALRANPLHFVEWV